MLLLFLLLFSLCGLVLSIFITLLYYRILQSVNSAAGEICGLDSSNCEQVVHSSYGRVFLLPNSVYGLSFYLTVTVATLAQLNSPILAGIQPILNSGVLLDLSLVSAAASVVIGTYLIHALFARLKTFCSFCLLGHAINFCIFVLLLCLKLNQ